MAISPSITAKPGFQFILKVAAAAVSPTNFVTVGGLRNTTLTINNNPADITNAASAGFQELLPAGGIQSFQVTSDGVFDSNTTGAQVVFDAAMRRNSLIEAKLESGHGDAFYMNIAVTQATRGGPFDGAETFSIQFSSSGRVIYSENG